MYPSTGITITGPRSLYIGVSVLVDKSPSFSATMKGLISVSFVLPLRIYSSVGFYGEKPLYTLDSVTINSCAIWRTNAY